MQRQNKTLAELVGPLNLYPQTLINVKVAKGFDWKAQPAVVAAAKAAEHTLGSKGRVLIRPSGTEPVVRVMVEASEAQAAQAAAQSIAQAMRDAVAQAPAAAVH